MVGKSWELAIVMCMSQLVNPYNFYIFCGKEVNTCSLVIMDIVQLKLNILSMMKSVIELIHFSS